MRRKKPKHRFKHPLIPGFWYAYINFPFLILFKSGETSVDVNVRAKQVDRAAPGIPIPIFFVWTPFNRQLERLSHVILRPIRVVYYKGDGHKEWFLSLGLIVVIPMMLCVWAAEIWILCFGAGYVASRNGSASVETANFLFWVVIEYLIIIFKFIKDATY